MRRFRQLSMAAVLMLALGASAFGGIIGGGPEPPPAPPSATAPGITDTPPSSEQTVAAPTDPVVDVALYLLQTVLSVV